MARRVVAGTVSTMPDASASPREDVGAPAPSDSASRSASRSASLDRLVWIDLEMTGLDVERDVIVEIACVVTDTDLALVDDGIDLVVHAGDAPLDAMSDFVRAMHVKSGLLDEIRASTVSIDDAGAQVLEYLKTHVPEQGIAPLCGNSIGMDRRFLARYLPEIDGYVHYRSIDVSSLKELCRRWYPEVYQHRPNKRETHRALDDIRESVAELRYYRETMLR
jgi:oligoribonuclease